MKKVKTTFYERVRAVVANIPKGYVMSYGEVAEKAGSKGAARAVGIMMSKNKDPQNVPCHRVVCSNGYVGKYSLNEDKIKIERLRGEGVVVVQGRVVSNRSK